MKYTKQDLKKCRFLKNKQKTELGYSLMFLALIPAFIVEGSITIWQCCFNL